VTYLNIVPFLNAFQVLIVVLVVALVVVVVMVAVVLLADHIVDFVEPVVVFVVDENLAVVVLLDFFLFLLHV
jgi:hypothetical protein